MEAFFPIELQIPSLNLALELLPDTTPLEECLLYLYKIEDQRQNVALPTRLTKNMPSVSMNSLSTLEFSLKVILSWSMKNINIPWGNENSNPCGSGHSLLRKS
jgi:hypothetical protein